MKEVCVRLTNITEQKSIRKMARTARQPGLDQSPGKSVSVSPRFSFRGDM